MMNDALAELQFMAEARRVRLQRTTRHWQAEAERLRSQVSRLTDARFRVLLGREDAPFFTDTSAEFVILTSDADLVTTLVQMGGVEDVRVEPPAREPIPEWLRGMINGG